MNATELLRDLEERGALLAVEGQELVIDAPRGMLTPELRSMLVERKPDLLALLSPQDHPPDDPLPDEIRWRLLLWGAPLGWPSLVEVGLGAGGNAWSEWLMAASIEDLKQAILAAVRAEHTTLALDMEALKLWPGAGIVREGQWTES